MADINTNPSNELVFNEQSAIIGLKRLGIANEAAGEIEQLSALILAELERMNLVENLALRGIARRIKNLSCIAMSSLSDEQESTPDLSLRLRFITE